MRGYLMRILTKISLLTLAFVVSCGNDTKVTDDAVLAMERARAAEADIYAPTEYGIANNIFNDMKEAMDSGDKDLAAELGQSVIDAANKSIEVARQNKATALIAKLKRALDVGNKLGIDTQYPTEYAQATQLLLNAEGFYSSPDYEKAISTAQEGLDILEPLIGGAEALALANLNRARELLDRAYKTTDQTQTQEQLTIASKMIEQAAIQYQNKNFLESINTSQDAIDLLNDLITRYPGDGTISISINEEENLQLQAYDLIRQLGQTIQFIKDNNYSDPVHTSGTVLENSIVEEKETTITNSSMDIETNFVEEEFVEYYDEDSYEEDVEVFLYEGDELSYLPMNFKAQSMGATEESNINMITVEVIERYHQSAQQSYNQGNYLNAIDQAREGIRLAELYLAGQTLKTHTVIKGDTLWDISGSVYKQNWLWPNIWRANKLEIKDPDLIYPKQKFRIPPASNTNK